MNGKREGTMRCKCMSVCLGYFHSDLPHRNVTFSKALVAQLSILRHENVLLPVTASCNNLKTCVSGHLIFTRNLRASRVAQLVKNLPAA